MTAKEMRQRLMTGIEGTAFELRSAYGQYELWANDNRLEAGSIQDVYKAWIKYRFNPKYQKESVDELIESGIKKITRRMLKEDDNSMDRYYANELSRLSIDDEISPSVIFSNGVGQKTKNLNLNNRSIPIIIKWLKSIQSKLPRGGSAT